MCTYETAVVPVRGSAKGRQGWFALGSATVYFDHPVDADAAHTLNVDFRHADGGAERLAVELHAAAARRVAEAILEVLDSVPADLRD